MSDDVRRGDIFALGQHRLACIDSTDKAAVARLFAGQRPTLVVTSPPYADARDYNDPIACWDTMMFGALDGHVFAKDVQLLVNLGPIHREGEFVPYWNNWLRMMRNEGWKFHGQGIWHKTNGLPHARKTRMTPNFEFIFHLHKIPVVANRTRANVGAGVDVSAKKSTQRHKNGRKRSANWTNINAFKIEDAVMSCPVLHPKESTGHPAQLPIGLTARMIACLKKNPTLVFDPFSGSGTTLIACEKENVNGLAAEISPAYVQIAIDRWRKVHPDKPVLRLYGHAAT